MSEKKFPKIQIYVSEEEKIRIAVQAAREGKATSEYVKALILEDVEKKETRPS